jgi:type IV pilus modification protein PilV
MKLICKRKRTNCQEGFTFIEIIIAIALLAFGLLAMASMQVMAMKTNGKANRMTERATIGMNKIESLMVQAEQDYDGIDNSSDSTGFYDITWSVGVDKPSTPIPNAVLPIKRKEVTLYIKSNSTALNDKPLVIKGILIKWPQ